METFNHSIFENFPLLHTQRLTLRSIEHADAKAIFNMRRMEAVNRFIARPPMQSVEDAKALVNRVLKSYADKEAIGWMVMHKEREAMIGSFGYKRIETENLRAEIGGELHPDFWGKGIAQEAFGAVVEFGLKEMKLHTIEAQVWPNNRSAIALLESRGFVKEGHFKECMLFNGKFIDRAIYALVVSDQ